MKLSVIVPTRNEAPNVERLIFRVAQACSHIDAELLFVDDSTDNTPAVIAAATARVRMPVRVIHRKTPTGGLSGAVVAGVESTDAEFCMVMNGDLQHPPELIPALLARLETTDADVVVASRYGAGGGGFNSPAARHRQLLSRWASRVSRSLFPVRLQDCSDPMAGFFGVRRSAIDCRTLRPSGFKILLEILARHRLSVTEVPFILGLRTAGKSKAGLAQGLRFLRQLGELRGGPAFLFAAVGAAGALLNLVIMASLLSLGVNFVPAAILAAELTIVSNFLLQENLVFGSMPHKANGLRTRFLQSFCFNNLEAAARLPLLMLAVDVFRVEAVPAQASTLLAAFVVRYLYHTRIVYAAGPAPTRTPRTGRHLRLAPPFTRNLRTRSAGEKA